MPPNAPNVTVQVIIPARNEEDCIRRCLESLAAQHGISFEIIMVDDGSTDRTREIAESIPGIRVIAGSEPPPGISGKCNALILGTRSATADWLLFTDADTFHYPDSLAAAVKEAEERGVDLLSYSPEQETGSWYEGMLMPVIYAELARSYSTEKVNDPADPTVAANGQYVLVKRALYEQLGGHARVADKLLEDVELARLFKAADRKIWFRFGLRRVRTRMYRSFAAMWEGWTKNLAILFPHPLGLAALRLLEFVAIVLLTVAGLILLAKDLRLYAVNVFVLALVFYLLFLIRIRRAHFPWSANLLGFLGLPLFSSLLVRSWLHSRVRGAVTWKGRKYIKAAPEPTAGSSTAQESKLHDRV
jgi:glycosyltransferase involved in cell wall biosynthesis